MAKTKTRRERLAQRDNAAFLPISSPEIEPGAELEEAANRNSWAADTCHRPTSQELLISGLGVFLVFSGCALFAFAPAALQPAASPTRAMGVAVRMSESRSALPSELSYEPSPTPTVLSNLEKQSTAEANVAREESPSPPPREPPAKSPLLQPRPPSPMSPPPPTPPPKPPPTPPPTPAPPPPVQPMQPPVPPPSPSPDNPSLTLPPSPRPSFPAMPSRPAVQAINSRFLSTALQDFDFAETGVLLHHFDGWEDPLRPWAPCPKTGGTGICTVQISQTHRDRVSSTLISSTLNSRAHPRSVIGVYSYSGGVVLRPDGASVLCGYGTDGAIDYGGSGSCVKGEGECVPGCGNPPAWCTRETLVRNGWCRCGFAWCSGSPNPWHVDDVGFMLDQQAEFGSDFEGFGKYKGYNEIVVDSDSWIEKLPQSIEAIFFVECGSWEASGAPVNPHAKLPALAGGYGAVENTCAGAEEHARSVHAAFTEAYGSKAAVPLLMLRLNNWAEPFVQVEA